MNTSSSTFTSTIAVESKDLSSLSLSLSTPFFHCHENCWKLLFWKLGAHYSSKKREADGAVEHARGHARVQRRLAARDAGGGVGDAGGGVDGGGAEGDEGTDKKKVLKLSQNIWQSAFFFYTSKGYLRTLSGVREKGKLTVWKF